MRAYLIFFTLQLPAAIACAQQNAPMEWADFRARVLAYHPLSRQADLYPDEARAGLLRAKGGFDPKVYADLNGKNFKDKTYYQYGEAGVKWPLWLGLELKGNYNQASGTFLNPESSLPQAGQVAAGISWTLGQGLLMDERRYQVRQGRVGLEQGDAERSLFLNDLLLEAAKTYWNWVVTGNVLEVYEEALRQAQIRHEGLLESFRQGDKPAIDTLETFIQVQNRRLDTNFAQIDRQNAALALNNFLWSDNGLPLSPAQIPPTPSLPVAGASYTELPDAETLLQTARARHPEIRLYQVKQAMLDLELQWKREKRKPVLDLNYHFLGNGWQFFPTAGDEGFGVLANNVKWGVQFSYPLPNRKARGDWQITQIKIAQTDLQLQQKKMEIENKVRQYRNELANLSAQIELFRAVTENYRILLDAENEKFRFGESSVFLINTREQRWLDARVKYLKLLSEFQKTAAGLQWAAGSLQ